MCASINWSKSMAYEPNNPESMRTSDPTAGLEEKVLESTAEAKARASELGRRASQKAEQVRNAAAGRLDSAASAMHERAENLPGGRRVAGAAHGAADALHSSADYLREHDMGQMADDLREVVRNHPGVALLGAAALGFLVGRAMSRD
jgi:ElaB/YqjD/DUF883 family membrane-anchored ribosome-binding protein